MTLRIIWFVLAGFLLGFSISTLWEWFHFRRERIKVSNQRIRELEAQLEEKERLLEAGQGITAVAPVWEGPAYQSAGVFLETEEIEQPPPAAGEVGGDLPAPKPQDAPHLAPQPPPARFASLGAARDRPTLGVRNGKERNQKPDLAPTSVRIHDQADLAAEISHPEVVAPESPPVARALRKTESSNAPKRAIAYPDDLSKIKGIGEVYKFRLYQAGIFTWHQLTETDEETLREATKAYPSANADEWGPQARKLAEKHNRIGAIYDGPVPEDLTQIYGIGPVSAQALYKAGICTYAHLAASTPEELTPIFPIAVAGDEPDFEHWIQQAQQLAQKTR